MLIFLLRVMYLKLSLHKVYVLFVFVIDFCVFDLNIR